MNQPHVNMSAVQTTTGRWALQDLRGRSFLLFYEGRCGGLQSQVHDLICFITFRFSTRPASKYPNICPNMSNMSKLRALACVFVGLSGCLATSAMCSHTEPLQWPGTSRTSTLTATARMRRVGCLLGDNFLAPQD